MKPSAIIGTVSNLYFNFRDGAYLVPALSQNFLHTRNETMGGPNFGRSCVSASVIPWIEQRDEF